MAGNNPNNNKISLHNVLNGLGLGKVNASNTPNPPSSGASSKPASNGSSTNNASGSSVKYIPDYGLPDLSIIYRHLPSSLSLLQKYITFTLLKYEPRVQALQI
jgi:hypothetical protein